MSPRLRHATVALVCLFLSLCPNVRAATAPPPSTAAPLERATATTGGERAIEALPMGFEPNVGQCDGPAEFLARGRGYGVFLTRDSVLLGLGQHGNGVRMRLVGANPDARLTPERALPGVSNYLVGSDPQKWHRDVPTYAAVRYTGVYDGVDMLCYGSQQRLEYDLEIAAGADPSRVRLRFEGQRTAMVDDDGDLVLALETGELRQQRAVVYQQDGATKRTVAARYTLGPDGEVGIDVGEYDRARPLVIDPVLIFEDFIGGSLSRESAADIAVDASGNAYVLGSTDAIDFPTSAGAFGTTLSLGSAAETNDTFVTKFDPTGSTLLYSTYLGGSAGETAGGIAVDTAGRAYVTGTTYSNDFPTTPGAFNTHPVLGDAFVVELAADGTGLVYSTGLGGSSNDIALAIAVDGAGRATVTGQTISTDFPTTPGAYDHSIASQANDVFVTRLNAGGGSLAFSTYLGGASDDFADAVAFDTTGAVIVAGVTTSSDFPVTDGVAYAGGYDAFLAKLAPDGGSLRYARYFGGEGSDFGLSVVVDASGAAYMCGATTSAAYPVTPGAFHTDDDATIGSAFVTKVSLAGLTIYSARFGGMYYDSGDDLALDANGNVYVACTTGSPDFPTTALAYDRTHAGGYDAAVAKLNASGSGLIYSTFVGGSDNDSGCHVALTASNAAVIAGTTGSIDFPTTPGAYRRRWAAGGDVFVTAIAPNGRSLGYSTYLTGTVAHGLYLDEEAYGAGVDAAGNSYVTGLTESPNFPTTAGAYETDPAGSGPDLGVDAYVSKISADGTHLIYSTFLGGASADIAYALAVDPTGGVYVAGSTSSADFPTTPGAADSVYSNESGIVLGEGFVAKLSPAGDGLVYATYLGGESLETVNGIAVGAGGVAYATGYTQSTDFPVTAGAFQTSYGGTEDAFVTAIASDGRSFVYSAFLGGAGDEIGTTVSVDATGAAYVTGAATADFPTTQGAFDVTFNGTVSGAPDAYVAKVAPNGAAIIYATYLGGSGGQDVGNAIVVDRLGNAFVAGYTYSTDFPTTEGAYDRTMTGVTDAFVTKLSPSGGALVYSTFLGGENGDGATAVMLDASGDAIVAGGTASIGFPTTPGAVDTTLGVGNGFINADTFVTYFDASGSRILYSTFLGGDSLDECYAAAVDPNGAVVVVGRTWSTDWATTGFGGRDGSSAFVARLDGPAGFAGDTPGVYIPTSGAWFLRDSASAGGADAVFTYGAGNNGFVSLAGDWNGDGGDSPGLYSPSTGTFFLRNTNGPGAADLAFSYGPIGTGVIPLVGDWNGDGTDTIGIYVSATGTFFLRNSNSPGLADLAFQFGSGSSFVPLSGDWNGDGTDTVGLYLASSGTFFLRDSNTPGTADAAFAFGPPNVKPLVGDWNGDRADTIGVYVSATGTWFLKNANRAGVADRAFAYGPPASAPLVGNWDGR